MAKRQDSPIFVGLTSAEYQALERDAHRTSREVGQYVAHLIRLSLARRLRVIEDAGALVRGAVAPGDC